MATGSHKSVIEEIGQRTARNEHSYLPKGGYREGAFCRECGATYCDKRWSVGEAMTAATGMHEVLCPACRRMHDHNPGGVVTLTGEYLRQKADAIMNEISHIESVSRRKNPLGRIMGIEREEGRITISTTEDRLAQKMGREVQKAHKGELHYRWAPGEDLVRISWSR